MRYIHMLCAVSLGVRCKGIPSSQVAGGAEQSRVGEKDFNDEDMNTNRSEECQTKWMTDMTL